MQFYTKKSASGAFRLWSALYRGVTLVFVYVLCMKSVMRNFSVQVHETISYKDSLVRFAMKASDWKLMYVSIFLKIFGVQNR